MFARKTMGASADAVTDIGEVFSAFVYDGTGAELTITNDVDLSTDGGMVWVKGRSNTNSNHLFDTERGVTKAILSDTTAAESTDAQTLKTFNTDGFTLGTSSLVNANTVSHMAYSFKKTAKFFDVVKYTGNASAGRAISHSLGQDVGMIVVFRTNTSGESHVVFHRGDADAYMFLDTSAASVTDTGTFWGNGSSHTAPTSTDFTVSADAGVNASGDEYVAYLWAHDTGTDGLIQCSSYTGNGTTGQEIDLGWQPQYLLIKNTDSATPSWALFDSIRGIFVDEVCPRLRPNLNSAETTVDHVNLTAKGFELHTGDVSVNTNTNVYVYIAIRGPMMTVPTAGTDVFSIDTRGSATPSFDSTGRVDMAIHREVDTSSTTKITNRLIGPRSSRTDNTGPDASFAEATWDYMDGWNNTASADAQFYSLMWTRAKGFFDVVSYVGNASAGHVVDHQLGVVPEMMWVKVRDSSGKAWRIFHTAMGNTDSMKFTTALPQTTTVIWNDTSPTATQFTLGGSTDVNENNRSILAYLFATVAGVSKVGTYTGDGGSGKVIDCGFAAGARFVMIKRTSGSSGSWFHWNATRGIVAGNDAHLIFENNNAEVTDDDSIDPDNSGFIVNEVAATNINVNTDTYIFYAVA